MSLFQIKDGFSFTLIFYPSPFGINWNSPGELLKSTIENTLWGFNWKTKHDYIEGVEHWKSKKIPIPTKHPHPISHVDVALVDNQGKSHFSGMSRKKEVKEILSALTGKSSFDKLVKDFPGYLSKNDEILKWLPSLIDQNRCKWITFNISKDMYNRLLDYYHEYQEKGYDQVYSGFHADPLKGEGAGCAKYARSFLEVAGLNHDDLEKIWSFDLHIPSSYFPHTEEKPKVGISDMLFTNQTGKWATPDEGHIHTKIYDPAIMYHHIIHLLGNEINLLESTPYRIKSTEGLIIDARDAVVPTQKYWR